MALEPSEKYQCGTSLSVMSFVKNLKIGKTQNFQFRRAYCQYKNTPFFSVWMWKPSRNTACLLGWEFLAVLQQEEHYC